MFTTLIAGLLGLVTNIAPALVKEMQDTRNQKREIEHLTLQHQMQLERAKIEADSKLREADAAYDTAHVQALQALALESMKPTGMPWIDALNAIIRPVTCILLLVLFVWTSLIFISGVITAYDAGKIVSETKLAEVIWGSMIGEAFQAVFGYLFVSRECRKRLN